jgi:type VI secretion system secreted protein VgrG
MEEGQPEQTLLALVDETHNAAMAIVSLRTHEALSTPFEFLMDLTSAEVGKCAPPFKMGEALGVRLETEPGVSRIFHGRIARLRHAGHRLGQAFYHVRLVPWFSLLELQIDSRIFQQKTIVEITEEIFRENGLTDFRNDLQKTYPVREFCVQYQESTYSFLCRLWEQEGIFYFFEHEETKHMLILSDSSASLPELSPIHSFETEQTSSEVAHSNTLFDWSVQSDWGTVTHILADYNFKTPLSPLLSLSGDETILERQFEFPGGFLESSDGDRLTSIRSEEALCGREVLSASTLCPCITVGGKFAVSLHPVEELKTSYFISTCQYDVQKNTLQCHFESLNSETVFRPQRRTRQPQIAGAHTALVVGESGQEVTGGDFLSVKVKFPWDRRSAGNEESSCWVRVAQGWAGKGFGTVFIPRIGQEVIVTFLQGDPNKPLITGSVYNGANPPPYSAKEAPFRSALRSKSSEQGEGYNELSFSDVKDSEEVLLVAQKDFNQKITNDFTTTVENNLNLNITQDRTTTLQKGNDTLTISEGDGTFEISQGNVAFKCGGDTDLEIAGSQTLLVKGDESCTVYGDSTRIVMGDFELKVTGTLTLKADKIILDAGTDLTLKAGKDLEVTAAMNLKQTAMSIAADASASMTNKAPSITNEASATLTNKGGAAQTVEGGGMLTLKGGLVKIN